MGKISIYFKYIFLSSQNKNNNQQLFCTIIDDFKNKLDNISQFLLIKNDIISKYKNNKNDFIFNISDVIIL